MGQNLALRSLMQTAHRAAVSVLITYHIILLIRCSNRFFGITTIIWKRILLVWRLIIHWENIFKNSSIQGQTISIDPWNYNICFHIMLHTKTIMVMSVGMGAYSIPASSFVHIAVFSNNKTVTNVAPLWKVEKRTPRKLYSTQKKNLYMYIYSRLLQIDSPRTYIENHIHCIVTIIGDRRYSSTIQQMVETELNQCTVMLRIKRSAGSDVDQN